MQLVFRLLVGECDGITPSKFKEVMHLLGEDLSDEEVCALYFRWMSHG